MVFDEAHEIEDVAGQYFGVSVSNYQLQDLSTRRRGVLAAQEVRLGGTRPHSDTLEEPRRACSFCAFSAVEGRVGFRGHVAFFETHREKYAEVLLGAGIARYAPAN